MSQMEGGWPDDSIGRASDGGALCSGHASLHVQPRTESKVDVRSCSRFTVILFPHVPSRKMAGLRCLSQGPVWMPGRHEKQHAYHPR